MNGQRPFVTHQHPTHLHISESPVKCLQAHEDSCGPKSLEIGSTSAVSGKDVQIMRTSARNQHTPKKGGQGHIDNPEVPQMSQSSGRGTHPTFQLRDRTKISTGKGKKRV